MNGHAVIIGAGPGGLAAAMLLANAGVRVTLFERHDRVGGRTTTIGGDGYRFDLGPTFFLYPAILEQIFQACGMDLHDEVELIRLDPQYHLVFEQGGDIKATPDLQRMREQVASVSPADADGFARFMEENRRKFAAFKPILQRPFSSPLDLISTDAMKSSLLVRPWASVDRDLRRHFQDPRVRLAFSFQSKYLGMSPFNCPSLFTILSFLEYEYGVWHPVGGCGAVSKAMARAAERMGVDIRLNQPVQRVITEHGKAVGVVTDEGETRCDALVINADFAQAMKTLVPDRDRRRWTDRKLAKKKYSCSTFMMYLGIDGEMPEHLQHHTIFLSNNYQRNLEEIESLKTLPENPSFYVQHPGRTDPSLAPAGKTALYVLAPVPHESPNIDWSRDAPRFRTTILKQMSKLGLADIEDRIEYEQVITPDGWRDGLNIYRGATFNLAHSLGQMLHLRPRNRFEDLGSTYLVGGGTHPGSGLPVIYESARITSRLLLEDLGVTEPTVPQPIDTVTTPGPSVPKPEIASV